MKGLIVNGFGVINTRFDTLGTGRFGNYVNNGGYGFRGAVWDGGQSLGSIVTDGDGSRLKTTSFPAGVRLSETLSNDPFFGGRPRRLLPA